jgi:hypothetical protein
MVYSVAVPPCEHSPVLETRDCGIVLDDAQLIELLTFGDKTFFVRHGGEETLYY